ncbi:MAG: hypothetical protein AAFZ65_01940, partial [Planctomycetota bacterium]
MRTARPLLTLLCLALAGLTLSFGQAAGGDFEAVRAAAEALVEEGSHQRALERYRSVESRDLSPEQRRWLEFRLADLDWRAAPAQADSSRLDAARARHAELAPDDAPPEARDLVWAEAQVSLGDLRWSRKRTWKFDGAYEHYARALDWWARSSDVPRARERWLEIFWGAARPAWAPGAFFTNYGRGSLDASRIEQAIELARDDEERAQAEFALAQVLLQRADEPRVEAQVFGLLEGLAARGKQVSVHDDALYALATRLRNVGRYTRAEDGAWVREPDLEGALEQFEALLEAYTKSESGVWSNARSAANEIRQPEVHVWTPGTFLPGSELGFGIAWRNASKARITLRRVDLDQDVLVSADEGVSNFLNQLNAASLRQVAEWSIDLERSYGIQTRMERLRLDGDLPRGAYLLEATIDGDSARELLLVTQAAVVLAGTGSDLVVWAVDASSGEPLPEAQVTVNARAYDGSWVVRDFDGLTDADGLARFDLRSLVSAEVFVAVRHGEDQALAIDRPRKPGERERFKALVTTDRPAYRPEQTVNYSLVVRDWEDGWRAADGVLE